MHLVSFLFFLSFYFFSFFCMVQDHSNVERKQEHFQNKSYILNFDPKKTKSLILDLIADAQKSIEISFYSFEEDEIAQALVKAFQLRDISIRISSEFDSESSPTLQKLIYHGLPIRFGNVSGLMHNKYMIFDDKYVLTGSSNLSRHIEKHFNHIIIVKSSSLAQEYLIDFELQFAGAYANQKDELFQELYGENSLWETKTHIFKEENSQIRAYFTPYKSIFPSYTQNRKKKGTKEYIGSCYDPKLEVQKEDLVCLPKVSSRKNCNTISLPKFCKKDEVLKLEDACYAEEKKPRRSKIIYSYLSYDHDWYRGLENYTCAPYDNAMNEVISFLRRAETSILVLAFSLRDPLFIYELIEAKKRGLRVQAWIDYNQYRSALPNNPYLFLALAQGIDFLKLNRRANGGLLHHKVIVIDEKDILLGSLNFSFNAVRVNDENFLIIKNNPSIALAFYKEAIEIDSSSFRLSKEILEDHISEK